MARSNRTSSPRKGNRHVSDRSWLVGFLVIAATAVVYVNAYDGAFLFDDAVHILQNGKIRRLWPLAPVLTGRRPLVDLTLAVNYRLDGFEPVGYHGVNIAIHALAALALYGVVRQTLLRSSHRENSAWGVSWVALAVALIWAAHPLQTQSVTYLIQRSESMMGLFYLLTLYCVIRGAGSTDWTSKLDCQVGPTDWTSKPAGQVGPTYRTCWYITAVLCCALGMGSKGVMVTAPVVVLLYDRAFLGGSWVEALRRRWGLYASLAATWAVLWACGVAGGVLDPSRKHATMGFALQEITPWQYAATQPGVILHYMTLSLWPHPLCLDHSWPVVRTAGAIVLPGVLVGLLLAATAWAMLCRPRLGFAGVWFFVILAPTSSVIPIKDTLFEHRMYLSLAAVVVLLVVGSDRLLRQLILHMPLLNSRRRFVAGVLVVTAAAVLAVGTIRRNQDYHGAVSMWKDVVAKRPWNARAFEQLGTALIAVHNKPDAITAYHHAVRVDPDFASAHANLGNALSETGRFAEAVTHYSIARRLDPQRVDVCINLALALEQSGRIEEAIATYRDAARIEPHPPSPRTSARAHYNLAHLLHTLGRLDEAVTEYRKAVRLWSHYEKAHFALGWVLTLQGELDEAVSHFERTLQINPHHTGARNARADALRKLASPDSD